jgi:hypothetical protein
MEHARLESLKRVFEKLAEIQKHELASTSSEEHLDPNELDEIQTLREIVSETMQPPQIYFTRT